MGILTLSGKHRGHPRVPGLLDRGQNAQLVVHQDIVLGRVTPLDIIQRLLFMNVDEHVAFDSFEDARAFDLARLKNHIAVREDYRLSPRAEPLEHVERSGIEPIGERVVHQE